MKKLLTILMAAAMLFCAALPVMAAEEDASLTGSVASGNWEVADGTYVTGTESENNAYLFNDKMEAGKITVTIDRTNATKSGHDGIMFCISEGVDKFWEREVDSYYFMFIEGGNGKIGLAKSGDGYGGWKTSDFPDRYVIPEEDKTGVYTLTAEWDGTGTINAYLNGEKVFTWKDNMPMGGTRYGIRAASKGVKITDVTAEPAEVAEGAVRNGQANAIPGTATVDGVIDDAWAKAPVYTMSNEVSNDCRGDAATRKDSSSVQFRMMYSGNKVYLLVEVEDDVWTTGDQSTNWRNDSLMIFVSENGTGRGTNNENRYCMVAFLENHDENNAGCTGFFTRNNNGTNTKAKEHAVVKDGTKAVMELSFELNGETPVEGGHFAMDLQYNDQDLDPATAENQSRTIVWAWSCSDPQGPNTIKSGAKGWGDVWFVAEPECEHKGGEATCTKQAVCTECGEAYGDVDLNKHGETELKDAKEATETEPGYTGDKVCKDCGNTLERGREIPATGVVNPPVSEEKPPKTGDSAVWLSALAVLAVAGAVVVTRRRKVSE